jgi:2-desacetyl-2-hydroxyethyl bacteriochlorophyllide A dehydrogenase
MPEIADCTRQTICGPDSDEVLVSTEFTAISTGTELAGFLGLPGASRGFPYVPGYSGVGRVLRVGSGVRSFSPGQRVVGRLRHSSRNVVKKDFLFACPDSVPAEAAALLEIGIISLQGVRKASICPGTSVVVLGCGIIGQMAIRLARLAGAAPVIAVAAGTGRREAALAPGGADAFLRADEASVSTCHASVVLETTGVPSGFDLATRLVERGGQIVLLGSTRGVTRPVPIVSDLAAQSASLVGAHVTLMPQTDSSPSRWSYRDEGVLWTHWLSSGRLNLLPLVTHRLRPHEVPGFYCELAANKKRPVATVVDWTSITHETM